MNRREDHLERELRFHIDQYTDDLIAEGVDPDEARRRARLELGGIEQSKEECRDSRPTRWLDDLLQDIRYALRMLRQRPGFAAVALITLALGVGATTVMFTAVNGILLKPFAYREPDRVISLREQTNWSNQFGNVWAFTKPNYLDAKQAHSFDLAAWTVRSGTVTTPAPAEHQRGVEVEWNFFSMLGVNMERGRDFTSDDDRPGAPPVAIISNEYWQTHFAGSNDALGSRLVFDGRSHTIVGVTPPTLLAGIEIPFFTPLGLDTSPWMARRDRHGLQVWGRLRPGAAIKGAQSELDVIARRLEQQYPDSNRGRSFVAAPLRPDGGDESTGSMMWILLSAVGAVLLIACVNIASLMLARSISRERELAMRGALGASRWRLARQCLTESSVLAVSGGALGVALAWFGFKRFLAFWPTKLDRVEQVSLDWRVMSFAFGLSLVAGLLFGLAPAMRAGARSIEQNLRAGSRNLAGGARRLHFTFVAAEIALATVLLIGAGLLGRTLLRLSSADPGIDIHRVLTARTALSPVTLQNPDLTRADWDEILFRLDRIPGVEASATVDTIPMRQGSNQIGYRVSAAPVPEDQRPIVLANSVSPEYLKVMRLKLHAGRFIEDRDRKGAESVVVVDEVMAKQAWPGEDPVGKHVWIDVGPDPATVIGVVPHVRQWGAGDDGSRTRAQLYYPFAQVPDALVHRWSDLMSIAVRTSGDPLKLVEAMRREIRGATGDQVIYEINTMEQLSSATLAQQRFLLLLFGIFAGLALLLACIGIYGVLAYLTNQRIPEIGVRMALGASSGEVTWMILRQSLAMIGVGVVIGLVASIAGGRLLIKSVEGMSATEPSTFVVTISVLIAAALIASFVPARRASRVDPMIALRQE